MAVESISKRFILIEGVIQLVLGLLLLFSTDITLFLLLQLLGIYWLIRGVFMIIQVFAGEEDKNKGIVFFGGILGVIAGVLVLRYPLFSGFVILDFLVVFIALVGIIQGSISIIKGVSRKSFGGFFLGITLWLVSLIILFNLISTVMVLPLIVGVIWVMGGIALIAISFYDRK